MTTIITISGFLILLFFFVFRMISQYRVATINSLESQKKEVQSKYDFMVNQKRELQKEIAEKEKKLNDLKSKSYGINAISAEDLDLEEDDASAKISRYLISQGKITMEQNEQALHKMGIMKMDYLGVCLALGFIDLETSKQALKANSVSK